MNDKDKEKSKKRISGDGKKTGFYVALYSCVGIMLVLAVVIGYNNFINPGAKPGNEIAKTGEIDTASVGADTYDSYLLQPPYANGEDYNETAQEDRGTVKPTPTPQANPAAPKPQASKAAPSPNPQGNPQSVVPEGTETGEGDVPFADVQPVAEEPIDNSSMDEVVPASGNSGGDSSSQSQDSDDNRTSEEESGQRETAAVTPFSDAEKMAWPLVGEIVMDYSMDHVIYDKTLDQYRVNDTLCLSADAGTEVKAAADGVVKEVTTTRRGGKTVAIDHGNGWVTTYSQLGDDVPVAAGDVVTKGQVVGYVGNPSIYGLLLGNHLGFSVSKDSNTINPKDILAMDNPS